MEKSLKMSHVLSHGVLKATRDFVVENNLTVPAFVSKFLLANMATKSNYIYTNTQV